MVMVLVNYQENYKNMAHVGPITDTVTGWICATTLGDNLKPLDNF